MNYILVGIGGILGGLSRYQLGKLVSQKAKTAFPVGTFLINLTGALLLGLLSSLDAERKIYLFFGDGFLGTFTTFSTFMYEDFHLFQENKKRNALLYIPASLALGITGYFVGFALGRALFNINK